MQLQQDGSMDEALRRILTVHDHLGMWAAVGYRAGRLGMERLRPLKIKDMSCFVKLIYRTPVSCLLDGIQAGSYCTTGKGNLRFENVEHLPEIAFEIPRRGGRLVLRPREALVEAMQSRDSHAEEEQNTRWILSLDECEIFEVPG